MNFIGYGLIYDESSDLPISFWGYALETVAFLLNRVPSKAVEKTPYEICNRKSPSLSFLKIWGCEAYVKRQISDKLSPKSDKCLLWDILKKSKDVSFIMLLRTKCLLLKMVSLWKENIFPKEPVGVEYNLKKFKNHKIALYHIWNLNWINK